jgi:hypothetical protein
MNHSESRFPIGTAVFYKSKHPDFINAQDLGTKAVITQYSQRRTGNCFIEFSSGIILRVPESDLAPISE